MSSLKICLYDTETNIHGFLRGKNYKMMFFIFMLSVML